MGQGVREKRRVRERERGREETAGMTGGPLTHLVHELLVVVLRRQLPTGLGHLRDNVTACVTYIRDHV